MSGRHSNRPPISAHDALTRLVLMSLLVWALLAAASLAEHGRDGQWAPVQLVASASGG
jgi:hypothetical protein